MIRSATIHMNETAAFVGSRGQSSFAVNALLAAWSFRVQILLICGAGFLSVILGPDNNWDLRYYHLYAPWAYLHHRYLYDIGPTADFLLYALTSSRLNGFPRIVAFIMGAVHGINAALIFTIAAHVLRPLRRVEGLILQAVAVLVGVSGAGFVSLLGVTTNDLIDSIFVLASLLGVLKVAERAGEPADWAWPGLWLGIAFGLKYTAVVFIPGLALIAFIAAARQRSARGLMVFGVVAMLRFLVAAGHHLLTLWRDFGSPVFPLFNNIFQSPYYDPVALRDGQFLPRDFWQGVAFPWFWGANESRSRVGAAIPRLARRNRLRGDSRGIADARGRLCASEASSRRRFRGNARPWSRFHLRDRVVFRLGIRLQRLTLRGHARNADWRRHDGRIDLAVYRYAPAGRYLACVIEHRFHEWWPQPRTTGLTCFISS
jgi:Dolichyl-phosphate-mannose-protein mannosyltransferase